MALSSEYRAFIEELFQPAFPVRVRRMFGGAGIFADELMIALISDERIYLKVDEETKPDFEAEGMQPFAYHARGGKRAVMSYFTMPERLYDEPEELIAWACRARDAASRARSPKLKRVKKRR